MCINVVIVISLATSREVFYRENFKKKKGAAPFRINIKAFIALSASESS